jgi:hypothetical protein
MSVIPQMRGDENEKRFHVQIGLAEYTVMCETRKEAVRIARQRLHNDMPHMGGVIDGILDKHFRVDAVG